MMVKVAENYGPLQAGERFDLGPQDFGHDYAMIRGVHVPIIVLDLPAKPGTERWELVAMGLVKWGGRPEWRPQPKKFKR